MRTDQLTEDEYNPYYRPYITAAGHLPLLEGLEKGKTELIEFIKNLPEARLHTAYAEGKWTLAEVLLHLIDAERIFQYRALCFARNDSTDLPGFDENAYAPNSKAAQRSKASLTEEFKALRESTVALFKTFDEEVLLRKGMANGSSISVRAIGFIICGHQQHHTQVIRERYLS